MAARKSTKKNQTEPTNPPAAEPARLVIVDAANADDPAPDGSPAHPYARIQDAADAAGENAVIYARSGIYREAVALKPGQHLTSALELGGPLAGRTWTEPAPPVIELRLPRAVQEGGKDIPRAALLLPERASARRIGITLRAQGGEEQEEDAAEEAQAGLLAHAFLEGQGLSAEMLPEEKREALLAAMRRKVAEAPPEQRAKLLAEARDLRGLRGGAAAVLALPGRDGGACGIEVRDCEIEVSGGHMGIALVVPRFRALRRFRARGNHVRVERGNGDGIAAFLGKGARAAIEIADNRVSAEDDGARALRLSLPEAGARLEARVADNRLATGGDGADALHLLASGAGSEVAGEIAGNRIRTRGGLACGVEVQPRAGGLVRELTLRNNDIATTGERAKGINLWVNDKGGQENLTVADNAVVTSGGLAPALMAQCDEGSRVHALAARGNALTAEGPASRAMMVAVNRGAFLNGLECGDNSLAAADDGSSAFTLSLDGEMGRAALSGNRLETGGSPGNAALVINEGALGELDLNGNEIVARGDRACGVRLALKAGSRTGGLALAENRIACAGAAGHGIEFSAAEDATPAEPPRIRDNVIETGGAGAHGLFLRGRGIAFAGVLEAKEGNAFRVSGEGGQDLFFDENEFGEAPASAPDEEDEPEFGDLPDEQ